MKRLGCRIGIFCLAFLMLPITVGAQFDIFGNGVELTPKPALPEPGEVVTVSLNDFSLGDSAQQITWLVNDEEITRFANQRQISVTAGSIGETTTVSAVLKMSSGQEIPVQTTFTPSRVTLIIEPQTTTPFWYQGRPLATVGSTVRVIAIPQTGQQLPPESYSYTWRFNNSVADTGSIRGKFSNTFTMPFGRQAVLDVSVHNADGNLVARRSVAVPNQETELHFYSLNPLRGEGRLALTENMPLIGSEMTIRAEPFYFDRSVSTDDIKYEWQVDGRTVENPNQDQQTITLQNGGGIGRFRVGFHMRNLIDLLQGAEKEINITF